MLRPLPLLLLSCLLLNAPALRAGDTEKARAFRSLQFVLLVANPDAEKIPDAEVLRYQKLHRAHLKAMSEEGKMLVAGPFSDQADPTLRGLCLYDVGSIEEARRLAEADPAVVAGRMRVQVMTWWFFSEEIGFPRAERRARERAEAAAAAGD
ncbi:MAG: hypothetical protein JRH11_13455 [Deltaproteobacteria bacterium]|nr:hypothetical protein [Deltaproteobacteria bacterium]